MRIWIAAALLLAGCSASVRGHGAGTSTGDGTTPAPQTSTSSTTPQSTPTTSTTAPAAQPRGFRVKDVTFVGNEGWALGRTAVARSTDDGLTWSRLAAPPAHVGYLRFATDRIGYAFSPAALFMTTDGGRTWTRQPGGADRLETLNGNVIRIVDSGGCPPGCHYSVRLSAIGGTSWHTVSLPGDQGRGDGAQLVRTHNVSAIETYGNPAGGAENEQATLYTSTDNGASWVRRGEPCPQATGTEVDSSALTSADDGSLTVLCTPRTATRWQFTMTSTDGGVTFRSGYRRALGGAAISALGAASASIILASSDLTYRSTDGGRHFAKVTGPVAWLGFASGSVGHAISLDRRAVLTTTDAGRTWTSAIVR